MTRLPEPGGDSEQWGTILNDFLAQAHNTDGTLKQLDQSQVKDLVNSLAAKLNIADAAPVATSGDYGDLTNKPVIPATAADVGAVSATGFDAATTALITNTSSATATTLQAAFVTPQTATETNGSKLRRLALQAQQQNAFSRATLTAVPAWAATTAYTQGQVRSAGANLYICLAAGTSGATAPTTTLGRAVTDGSCIWAYFGRVQTGPTEPTAPTYSSATSAPGGLTNVYYAYDNANAFRLYGAYATNNFSGASINRFNQAAGSVRQGDARYAFWTDAPRVSLILSAASNARVRIDGRLYSLNSINYIASGSGYHTFDFSSTGGRKPRLFEVDLSRFTPSFTGVAVGPLDQVWAPADQDKVTAVFISDSIWDGSSWGPFAHTVPQILSAQLGWSDCWNFSIGGTGWLNPGTGPYYTFRQRVTEALTRNPDIILFQGSVNDSTGGYTAAQITAEVTTALQAIRSGGSKAIIIVLGVWSTDASSGIGTTAVETAVQAGVSAFTDPLNKTFFIPIANDPVLPWVTTPNNNAAKSVSINYTQLLASDNTHPTESGTKYLADRTERAIRHTVLPFVL